jgi:gliding motility-associated lipoprotein GldH
MKKTLIYLVILLPLIFISCADKPIYEGSIAFPNASWQRIEQGKDIEFDNINIKNIKDAYDINVSLTHKPTINVDNISFVLRIVSPSGMKKETIHTIELKDRDKVKFIGSDLGEIIEIKEPIKQYAMFSEKGEYKMIISNYSEKYEVLGLEKIGLEIVKSNLDYQIDK